MIASIDIGTNTVRLLIAEKKNDHVIPVRRELRITRLGEALDRTGEINPEAQKRTFRALSEYKKILGKYSVNDIRIFGTSALRDAKNSDDFIKTIKTRLGLSVNIISGRQEGIYASRGVFSGRIKIPRSNSLIIDIGGGSTEFIFCRKNIPEWVKSMNVGSVRLTERYITGNPVNNMEINKLVEFITKKISPVLKQHKKYHPKKLIGVAGTVTTLYAIDTKMKIYTPEKVDGGILKRTRLRKILDTLAGMTIAQRKEITGMDPGRADVIVAGGFILLTIMNACDFKQLTVSERDILYGVLL